VEGLVHPEILQYHEAEGAPNDDPDEHGDEGHKLQIFSGKLQFHRTRNEMPDINNYTGGKMATII
jgi:hypothetical protein